MQRAMVDYFKEMMANENIGFLRILKDVFGIDGILGQVFIVTHSAEVLSDDYRQIIRFYRQPSGSLKIACGVTFEVSSEAEEHLIAYFSAVKEALYTRCVMIVEGETEYSSFRQFAKTLGIPLDFYGIGLINARGQGLSADWLNYLIVLTFPSLPYMIGMCVPTYGRVKSKYISRIQFAMNMIWSVT